MYSLLHDYVYVCIRPLHLHRLSCVQVHVWSSLCYICFVLSEENHHEQRTTRWLHSHPDIPLPRRDVRLLRIKFPPTKAVALAIVQRLTHAPCACPDLRHWTAGMHTRRGVGASLKRTRIRQLPGGSPGPHALRPSPLKLQKRAALTNGTSVASCLCSFVPSSPGIAISES